MILIGIPYHKEKRYSLDHVLTWLEQQTHRDVEPILRMHVGPYGETGAIKEQFEFFRKLVLADNRFTHLYIMEVDTIPPLDALDKLLSEGKDCISATYYYRIAGGDVVAWADYTIDGTVQEVKGTGTGALLLSRKALETVSWGEIGVPDADYPYMDLLLERGIQPYLDTSLICRHYASEDEYF
jgi:hypothetical protein